MESSNTVIVPQETELEMIASSIQEWRRMNDEIRQMYNLNIDYDNSGSEMESANTVIVPQETELGMLASSIQEWRRINDEIHEFQDQIKERKTKTKALDQIILTIMKKHNIGALDLKATGGRVLTKKSKKQSGLNKKALQEYLSKFFKSEEKATEAMKFINESREVTEVERLAYERPV